MNIHIKIKQINANKEGVVLTARIFVLFFFISRLYSINEEEVSFNRLAFYVRS